MSIWGKIIGGFAGFAAGGPLGAMVGAAAGHAYDSMRTDRTGDAAGRIGSDSASAKQMAFSVAVVVLGAKMAKADGAVNRAEIDAFKRVFRIPPEEMKAVARIFDTAKREPEGFEPYATQCARLFRDEPTVLEELLTGLFHIARADGPITAAERNFLRRVAGLFGLGPDAFRRVEASFSGSSQSDPYSVLGISKNAAVEDIKRTYRQLIRENHPDTLIAKGMPAEFIDIANQRMASINAAYDQIERERGMK